MSEHEWLECVDPQPMLASLLTKPSHRKIRLLAVACCRRVWSYLPNEESKIAVEVSERFADGKASREDLKRAYLAAEKVSKLEKHYLYRLDPFPLPTVAQLFALPAWMTTFDLEMYGEMCEEVLLQVPRCCADAMYCLENYKSYMEVWSDPDFFYEQYDDPTPIKEKGLPTCREELAAQASLVRDIFGHLHQTITVDPCWLTESVVTKAQTIYNNRGFADLPILADALEEAGCNSAEMLEHCRSGGEHARGCWVVDLLLGKS